MIIPGHTEAIAESRILIRDPIPIQILEQGKFGPLRNHDLAVIQGNDPKGSMQTIGKQFPLPGF